MAARPGTPAPGPCPTGICRGVRPYAPTVQAVDGAGNVTQVQVPVKVDATPPQVQYHIPPATGQAGWHVAPVIVTVNGRDATSGVALAIG